MIFNTQIAGADGDGSLKGIIDGTVTSITMPDDLTSIRDYAFYECEDLTLTNTSLPNSIVRIGEYAFYGCYDLVVTSLPGSLTEIAARAFLGCTSIVSLTCSGTITTLATSAFNGSTSHGMQLARVEFPNMAVSSLSTVFGSTSSGSACKELEICDIGSTASIATNAFANCHKLQTLVLRKTGSICTLANVSAFANTPMRGRNSLTGTVYVPSDLISTYQTATNWQTLYDDGTLTFAAIEGSQYEL